ncbi:hypothetical protein VB773_10820 [Haloarculaceae archaeon H-GB2-1]|nr:hypothetical protein [Haloarculaceae archaeon H-GB1-1]MEA5386486.1 hypothetical protein [Haloarculaceae archaeon H-GB11]MEA5407999.1 hypothetical protein [Haloarculaceae archaeon H-GB2-1]
MSLDVSPPDPPELNPSLDADAYDDVDVQGEEYRREELQEFLETGAWEQAFDEWAASTGLTEEAYDIARELDMFAEFDFFWDDFADRVGYHAPGLPENWRERALHPDLQNWSTVSSINASLAEFGQIVCEVLKTEYVDWEADYSGPDDLPDFE